MRTLNDLKIKDTDVLREWAVEWIKELRTSGRPACGEGCCYKFTGYEAWNDGELWFTDNVVECLKDMFDLTEEDLE